MEIEVSTAPGHLAIARGHSYGHNLTAAIMSYTIT